MVKQDYDSGFRGLRQIWGSLFSRFTPKSERIIREPRRRKKLIILLIGIKDEELLARLMKMSDEEFLVWLINRKDENFSCWVEKFLTRTCFGWSGKNKVLLAEVKKELNQIYRQKVRQGPKIYRLSLSKWLIQLPENFWRLSKHLSKLRISERKRVAIIVYILTEILVILVREHLLRQLQKKEGLHIYTKIIEAFLNGNCPDWRARRERQWTKPLPRKEVILDEFVGSFTFFSSPTEDAVGAG